MLLMFPDVLYIMIIFLVSASAQKSEVFTEEGYAVNGYEVVAYLRQ